MTSGVISAAPSETHRGFITVAVMLATVMQVLDTTIVNVALPHMQGNLNATQDQISWVLTSYIIASAIMTPPTGWLSNRLGRKRLFLISVAAFTFVSMLCGLAMTLEEMVVFRILQGLFGAALVPLSQAVLLDAYPKEKHGSAMALWGMGLMVGPILGPTLGAYLTEYYNWRWVFYINLPVGIITLFLIFSFVHETEKDRSRPFDIFGFFMLSIGIGFLQLMLDRGQQNDWFSSSDVVMAAILAGSGFYFYVAHALTTSHFFIDPHLLRDRNFVTGLFFIFVVGIILLATLAIVPPLLQNLLGYPVMTIGLVLAPRGAGTMFAMFLVGRLVNRVDARWLIFSGLILTSFSLQQMATFNLDVTQSMIVWTGVVQGVGLGLIFVPLSTIAFATLEPRYRTEASSIFSLVRNMGSSIGISVVVALLGFSIQTNHAELAEQVNHFNPVFQGANVSSVWNLTSLSGLLAINGEINRQAAMIAYINDFKFMMFVSLSAIPLILLLRNPKKIAQPSLKPVAVAD